MSSTSIRARPVYPTHRFLWHEVSRQRIDTGMFLHLPQSCNFELSFLAASLSAEFIAVAPNYIPSAVRTITVTVQ